MGSASVLPYFLCKKINNNKKSIDNRPMAGYDEYIKFEGLNWRQYSTKYMTMDRVSADENKIVVRVGKDHLIQTRYGYALILDNTHVVFIKNWQVSISAHGIEVLLTKEYFNVKE